ncbi:5983_t:CDS:2, partial [Scutellospora calospora]
EAGEEAQAGDSVCRSSISVKNGQKTRSGKILVPARWPAMIAFFPIWFGDIVQNPPKRSGHKKCIADMLIK